MPAGRTNQTIYIGRGQSIESLDVATLYKEGELGSHYIDDGAAKEYQLTQCDSGATASTNAGIVAAGDLAFWKDRATYLVTNDKVQAHGGLTATLGRNALAGVFTAAVTAGRFCVIQQRGLRSVRTDGGGDFVINDHVVPSTNNVPDGDRTAQGTAPPVRSVGLVRAVEAAGFTSCDLDLPIDIP